jgi:hypothetical protein
VTAQAAAHREHVVALLAVSLGAPVRVIEVLPTPGRVHAGGLQVPFACGQIQTSVQAGGMTSSRIRSRSAGAGREPSGAQYRKPRPPRSPGAEVSLRRNRVIRPSLPFPSPAGRYPRRDPLSGG